MSSIEATLFVTTFMFEYAPCRSDYGNRKVSTGIVSCRYLFFDQTSNDTCAHLMVHISLPLCRSKDFRHSPRYTLLTSSQALKTIISLLSFESSYPSFVRYTLNNFFFLLKSFEVQWTIVYKRYTHFMKCFLTTLIKCFLP